MCGYFYLNASRVAYGDGPARRLGSMRGDFVPAGAPAKCIGLLPRERFVDDDVAFLDRVECFGEIP